MNAKEDQLAGRQRGGTLGRIPLQDEMPRQRELPSGPGEKARQAWRVEETVQCPPSRPPTPTQEGELWRRWEVKKGD